MKRHLQCAEQQASPSNLTKYCACHAKLHSKIKDKFAENSWSVNSNAGAIRAWSENDPSMNSSSRTRPFAEVTFRASETHLVLKITTFRASAIYPNFTEYCACHKKWHAKIPKCCASHKKWHSKTTKYCACHKKWDSKITKYCACHEKWCASLIVVTYETSFTMRGATGITLQPHQILRLPRKIALQNQRQICRKQLKRQFQCGDDSSMIREWSEHDPSMNSSSRTRPFAEVTFRAAETHFVLKITTFRASAIYPNFTEYCACHKKWHAKIPKCCASHKKWHSKTTKYCACHKKWDSKITKYCACHEKWCASLIVVTYETSFTMRGATGITLQPHQILRLPRKIALQNQRQVRRKQLKRQFQCGDDSSMIRAWSEHELVISHPPVRRGYFSRFGDAFCIENYNISRFGYLPKSHRILRLPQKVTLQDPQMLRQPQKMTFQDHQILRLSQKVRLQDHQILRLPRKMMRIIDCGHLWNVIYNARSNRHHPPTSGLKRI